VGEINAWAVREKINRARWAGGWDPRAAAAGRAVRSGEHARRWATQGCGVRVDAAMGQGKQVRGTLRRDRAAQARAAEAGRGRRKRPARRG
jgi:hypothetical protein